MNVTYSEPFKVIGILLRDDLTKGNSDQVPETGAIAVVSFPKPKGNSGFPARVFAVLP
jgi:kynurenine formamidase